MSSTAAFAAPLRRPASAFSTRTVVGWAKDTWHSLVAMTHATTGLPADKPVYRFASSVDNGWLGAALWVVRNAVPDVREAADKRFTRMRWDMFYDADTAHRGVRPAG